jgi:hypothetical protein
MTPASITFIYIFSTGMIHLLRRKIETRRKLFIEKINVAISNEFSYVFLSSSDALKTRDMACVGGTAETILWRKEVNKYSF